MTNNSLLKKLDTVEKIACSSKWGRLFNKPIKYISAIYFKEVVYPKHKKRKLKSCKVFFDREMLIALPASTDIYLTGGKSHDSEIRLARFLINMLQKGDTFLDIGAHYGYFTLLASTLVGETGKVYAYEPSNSFEILKVNAETDKNISIFKEAISDKNEEVSFFEFPNMYSEYNSMDIDQFDKEQWYSENKPNKIVVAGKTIDTIAVALNMRPQIIKIDVEGGEFKVISGAAQLLQTSSPYIIMEYLCSDRQNAAHQKAANLLETLGYSPYFIDKKGALNKVSDIESYLSQEKLESDNIVFKKG